MNYFKNTRNRIYNFIAMCLRFILAIKYPRVIPTKTPGYVMGSSCPAYFTASGIDARVWIANERRGDVQEGFYSLNADKSGFWTMDTGEIIKIDGSGTLKVVVFHDSSIGDLLGECLRLEMKAGFQDSMVSRLFNREVIFTRYNSRLSIDSIITEGEYDFVIPVPTDDDEPAELDLGDGE